MGMYSNLMVDRESCSGEIWMVTGPSSKCHAALVVSPRAFVSNRSSWKQIKSTVMFEGGDHAEIIVIMDCSETFFCAGALVTKEGGMYAVPRS